MGNENNELINSSSLNLEITLDKTKSFEDQAQDVATIVSTKKALEDEKLIDELSDFKKEELSEAAKANLKKSQAKSKDAEKELQKSIFGVYDGLASYIGLQRDLPKAMLKVLMFFIQPILGLVLLVIGLVVGIVNIILDGINSVVDKFEKLAGLTKKIVLSLFWIAAVFMFFIVIIKILEYFNIFIL